MWSFVGSKNNKQWIWLAIDADSREIVGVYVGEKHSSKCLDIMALLTWDLSSVRRLLHQLLGSV